MKTAKLTRQKSAGNQTIDLHDYFLLFNGKIYASSPLVRGLLGERRTGRLSYNNCHEIYLNNPNSNELDVEIEMQSNLHIGEVIDDSYPKDFPWKKPKLDSNGCLILKIKQQEQ
jgi:hypothetical protein